ncbi:hypothetical protein ACT80S_12905 [Ramlibacter sp. MAHUQ-53]|uniref:hypothetical protein n=1 Tax=unclassified Ramlibacter TaxID=2617605 RepID=UPI003641E79E
MAVYLQVRAGPVGLLLDALRVHEVVTLPEDFRDDQAFAEWRRRVLHVVRLAGHLQLAPGQARHGVVYAPREGDEPVMLCVDEVNRLRPLEDGAWHPLPPSVPAQTAALFDAVHVDTAQHQQLYRLKSDVMAALLGVPSGSAEGALDAV